MKRVKIALYALAGTLISVAAFAAEEAEGAHETYTFVRDWLPRLVNFGIIAFVLVYYTRKPIRDFFAARTAEIAKSMQDSKESRERAAAALEEMERKVKDLAAETERLIADARSRGEKDRQALIEEGGKVAQDVQAQVKQGIEIEMQKAKAALAVEASLLSLELAEGRIKENIGSQDHDRIVKEYIANVGGRG
jgi:F-type H+-transporting ATPase subunit b